VKLLPFCFVLLRYGRDRRLAIDPPARSGDVPDRNRSGG
jgi:hypothetical protein